MGGHCVACDRWWRADSQLVMSYWSPSTTSTASFVCLYSYSSTFACSLHLTKCSGQDSPSQHSCSTTFACCFRSKDPAKMTNGLEREKLAVKEGWELKMQKHYAGVVSWLNNYYEILLNPLNHMLYVMLKKRQMSVIVEMVLLIFPLCIKSQTRALGITTSNSAGCHANLQFSWPSCKLDFCYWVR